MNDKEFLDFVRSKSQSYKPDERLSVVDSARLISMLVNRGTAPTDYQVPCMLLSAYIHWVVRDAAAVAKARLLI